MKRVGIIVNPRKKEVATSINNLDQWIRQTQPDAEFRLCSYHSPFIKKDYPNLHLAEEREAIENADLIITMGGDGSILRAVKLISSRGIPVMGVNLGGLGFLAETPPDQLIAHLSTFLEDSHWIEERTLLKCNVLTDGHSFHAFNDIVIDKAGFSRVIEIITYVDDCLLNSYVADAVILSTPTGSTGYSLSAGGPIVIPQTHVTIINPICPHSLTNRPVVVPDDSAIQLRVFTEHKHVNLFRDGQMEGSYSSGTSFEIISGDYTVKLVKMKKHGFYETLRNKLHWGEDFRDKNRWSYNNK